MSHPTRRLSRVVAVTLVSALSVAGLAACSSGGGDEANVYFLNFKPEQDAAYQEIAAAYTEETGVDVKVVTAASGNYEQTLKAEIGKQEAPTIFQVNGPVGQQTWGDYMADLSEADFAKALKEDTSPLKDDEDAIVGVPFAVEGYGIIYNQAIMDRYFALPGAAVGSVEEITDFDTLKAVADDMQAKKAELGIDGVFASTSLASGEDWRWQTHLANIPVHYEFEDLGTTDAPTLEFTYNENFKNLFDLYLTDSTVEPSLAPSKSVTDSMAEFALGQAAMVQNGNWAWSQIADVSGNVVAEDDIKFMPMYTGMPQDPEQGLAIGTENYLAVNSDASEADQQASIDFLNWLFTSDAGKTRVVEDLGFIAPFEGFTEDDTPADPLARQVAESLANPDSTAIPWDFQYFPSQQFKNDFGQDLAQYASGNMEWDQVVENFRANWEAETAALQ
ncbi:ABC transporter substrate-binding protein [Corynebacterium guangdongense]|uniref:Raffinose/stachyose/melibiose transport system substrate-binding protein n=1 Tax=Corynebacterium guangdongense TaxID=1783348 RepID=A0ABU2A0Y7_9CORY|nr:ABC transporter substrate-binding protein [Corynebacterium guangdongense]MDR7330162.1 raffinose/stachyose/melibiose transport system substrate-binding protein [Corynebacterium guangdongense]WJZ18720.1 maltose ABC transporter periplasmic protein [Corynebacterium guangdongense]